MKSEKEEVKVPGGKRETESFVLWFYMDGDITAGGHGYLSSGGSPPIRVQDLPEVGVAAQWLLGN